MVHERRRTVLAEAASQDKVIMKTTLAILALGSLALMTSGAHAYRSNANGYRSYPNYDRQEYQNRVMLLVEVEPLEIAVHDDQELRPLRATACVGVEF
jgi:hypothetical protein